MSSPALLIPLTTEEGKDFLPPKVQAKLDSLPLRQIPVPLPLSDPAAWKALLQKHQPEALLCAWGCPPLPEDLPVGKPGQLRYVAYLAGSVKKLVPRKLIENGLLVSNWGNAISRTISECGLLLILTAMRRAGYWNVAMHRDGGWKDGMKTVTQSLFCRSIGLHGFGAIAQEMIPLLRPFDVTISAFSPSVPDTVFQKFGVTRSTSLEHLFSENDIVVELAPYTPKNHHIVTEKLLRSIRPGGAFINIGRGAVVDEAALIRVARDRTDDLQIGLDVYETEPLPKGSALRGLPNVALLPHIAGPTKDRRQDTASFAIENLQRFLQGKPLESLITLDVYDRAT
ncbi:MAG: hydroxyacid dehydrogenase [Verrucomicrobia bacterium]|nr:hydroxyacid dehydrogenase [Verrucomicrobiota bacterium]